MKNITLIAKYRAGNNNNLNKRVHYLHQENVCNFFKTIFKELHILMYNFMHTIISYPKIRFIFDVLQLKKINYSIFLLLAQQRSALSHLPCLPPDSFFISDMPVALYILYFKFPLVSQIFITIYSSTAGRCDDIVHKILLLFPWPYI